MAAGCGSDAWPHALLCLHHHHLHAWGWRTPEILVLQTFKKKNNNTDFGHCSGCWFYDHIIDQSQSMLDSILSAFLMCVHVITVCGAQQVSLPVSGWRWGLLQWFLSCRKLVSWILRHLAKPSGSLHSDARPTTLAPYENAHIRVVRFKDNF